MSNVQQQQVVKTKEAAPEFIMTKDGFMVVNHELVGEKLAALICESVKWFDKSGLTAIVLRNDGYPRQGEEAVYGVCHPDTNSIAINLERCWDRACAEAMEDKKHLSFLGILWVTMISVIGHELDHLVIAETDRDLYEEMRKIENGKDLEDSAKAAERQLLISLARDVDTEIPAPAELGWFGIKWMSLHTDEATKDLPWVVKAREMAEKGIIYSEPENEIEMTTFRQFVKVANNQEDDSWEQPTTPISLVVYLDGHDKAVVLPAEPVKDAVVEQVAVVDKIEAAAADVVMTKQPGETFVSAGMTVGDGEPDIVMADGVDEAGEPTIVMTTMEALAAANPTLPKADAAPVMAASKTPVVPASQAGLSVPGQVAAGQTTTHAYGADGSHTTETTLAVPLTPEVAAQQAVFAAAAATPTPPAPATYVQNNMDPAIMPQIMEAVWKTLYHHIFTKCGWIQNPSTGRYYFSSGAAILEHVNIQNILTQFGADNFIMEYDTLNAAGQGPLPELCQGTIRGHFSKKDNLPCYTIFLNIGGQRHKRTLMPQNPEKRNAQNAYSNPANEAGQGHQIAWIFNGDAPFEASFKDKCIAKITNTSAGISYELIS